MIILSEQKKVQICYITLGYELFVVRVNLKITLDYELFIMQICI